MRSVFSTNVSILFLVALLLSACAGGDHSGQNKKQVYIDANLLFSISYPEMWAPFLKAHGPANYSGDAISWHIKKNKQRDDFLSLVVISIPENGFITELDLLQEVLTDIYPNASFTVSGTDNLPAGLAFVLDGYTPQQTFRAWTLNRNGRHYLMICASTPEKFAEYLPLFKTIIQSFQVLDS